MAQKLYVAVVIVKLNHAGLKTLFRMKWYDIVCYNPNMSLFKTHKIEQYDWSKLSPEIKDVKHLVNPNIKQWRKKSNPKKVKNFYTCSSCAYEGATRKELDEHWLIEH